jgi:MraZ protein
VPDGQGRVAIPPHLREYAALDREVVVTGAFDHIEIWNAQRFRERDAEGIASMAAGEGIDGV